jgi:hypothetical protein
MRTPRTAIITGLLAAFCATTTGGAGAESGSAGGPGAYAPSSASVSAYDRSVLASRPVGYWTRRLDLSGRGRDGVFTGSPGRARMPNGDPAPRYDGVDEFLTIPDSSKLSVPRTGVLTVEAWLRPDTAQFPDGEGDGDGYVHWLGKGTPGEHEYAGRMYSQQNADGRPSRISAYAFNRSGGLGAGSYFQDAVRVGEWLHVAFVINTKDRPQGYPTGYTKIYKDGQLRDQDALAQYSIVPTDGAAPLRVGTRDLSSYFQGAVGKVAVYDRELTPAELLARYEIMCGRTRCPLSS